MSQGERTVQRLYPLGALTGRPISIVVAIATPVFAVGMMLRNLSEISTPSLAIAALVLTVAASITLLVGSSQLRAPLTSQRAAFVVLWADAALILGTASMWGTNAYIRNDWGTIVVGTMILALAPYRPARELVVFGVFSAILAGFLTLLEIPYFDTDVAPIVFVIVSVTPILILSIGPARFVVVVVDAVERWSRQSRIAVAARDDGDGNWIARSVQQDRVTILNRDIVPFFADILREDTVTAEDVERAREIANDIRAVMVAGVDRGWLHLIVEQAVSAARIEWPAGEVVADPARRAQAMTLDQRSAVRAFIGALFAHPGFSSHDFGITVSPAGNGGGSGGGTRVVVRARLDCTETQLRSGLAPYFAVMRVLFTELSYDFVHPVLTLQFSYDD